ncbi:MAG: PHP domain-containing protein, partial [Clostridia bacterium]|nr:PHP domain-containing protein [Clostridia bacterium]
MKTLGDLLTAAGFEAEKDPAEGRIEKIEIYRERQTVRLCTVFPRFIEYEKLRKINGQLHERILPDMRVELMPRFPKDAWSTACLSSVFERVRELDASVNGTFRDSTAEISGDKLIITLVHGGADLMLNRKTDKKIAETVLDWFGVHVEVSFTGKTKLESGDESVIEKLHIEEEKKIRAAVVEEVERYEAAMKEQAAKRRISIREGKSLMPQIILETARPILGNLPRKEPVPISDATIEAGRVTVWGEVFDIESKETRDGTRKIYSIDITDYTNSITLKLIQNINECASIDGIKKGTALLVTGSVEYDKYDRENVMRPSAIARADMVEVVDSAKEKRVELHLHTNMSSMDGMTPAGDLINQAYKWGQRAIAITDHGVAQAFPDAMNAWLKIKKGGGDFKVIYGVEAYFVNDLVPAASGDSEAPLDGEFICFDLETTG